MPSSISVDLKRPLQMLPQYLVCFLNRIFDISLKVFINSEMSFIRRRRFVCSASRRSRSPALRRFAQCSRSSCDAPDELLLGDRPSCAVDARNRMEVVEHDGEGEKLHSAERRCAPQRLDEQVAHMRICEEKDLVVRPGHEVIVRHTFRFLLDSCRSCHGVVPFLGFFAPLL